LPASVAKALAEAAGTADVPWQPAHTLARHRLRPEDLRAAIAMLSPPPVGEAQAAQCFARLLVAFEPGTRSTADETRLRLAVWLEANADLGDALWMRATGEAIRACKFMPRPAEFRALVADELARQASALTRCRRMLAALGESETTRAPASLPESRETRLATIRDCWRRLGRPERAAPAERQLAALEKRPPADWVAEAESLKHPTLRRPAYVAPSGPTAERFAVLADCHRRGVPAPAWDTIPVTGPVKGK